ncbi:cation acetate symporter, partial [Bacillus vallismortis]|nr:cation acetate symporter [Bacillus vallismortis]
VAASANLPLSVCTVFWKRFNASGALWGSLTGQISALVLVSMSPSVWDPSGGAKLTGDPLIPNSNPAIISIPHGFLGAWLGTLLSS